MSADYRFVVRNSVTGATREVTFVCASDADALTLGPRVSGGHDLEVWQGSRRLTPGGPFAPEPIAGVAEEIAEAEAEAAPPTVFEPPPAVVEPDETPEPLPELFDLDAERARVFNPFRRAAWRRLRAERG